MSVQAVGARRSGWVTFAAIVMFSVGFARIVSAINYFANGNRVADLTGSVYGDQLWVWGIWDVLVAALAFWAGYSLLSNGRLGRVIGYLWATLVIVQALLIISVAPWYAVAAIALATLVVVGLALTADESWGV